MPLVLEWKTNIEIRKKETEKGKSIKIFKWQEKYKHKYLERKDSATHKKQEEEIKKAIEANKIDKATHLLTKIMERR